MFFIIPTTCPDRETHMKIDHAKQEQSKTLHTLALCRQCLNVNPEFGVAAQRSDTLSL